VSLLAMRFTLAMLPIGAASFPIADRSATAALLSYATDMPRAT
jgi:hypothetical protein